MLRGAFESNTPGVGYSGSDATMRCTGPSPGPCDWEAPQTIGACQGFPALLKGSLLGWSGEDWHPNPLANAGLQLGQGVRVAPATEAVAQGQNCCQLGGQVLLPCSSGDGPGQQVALSGVSEEDAHLIAHFSLAITHLAQGLAIDGVRGMALGSPAPSLSI